MYESVKKEVAEAVERKVAELGQEINGILMHHVGDMMREVMMFGLEGKTEKGTGVALNLPDEKSKPMKPRPKPKKSDGTYLAGTGPDLFSPKGSRLPPVGSATRTVYDYVVKHGDSRPGSIVRGCEGAATKESLYSLIRQLYRRGFLSLKNGKYSAIKPVEGAILKPASKKR